MAFNLGLPSFPCNGVEPSFEIDSKLDRMSFAQLSQLLNDSEKIKKLAEETPEVVRLISLKEAGMEENKKLAEANQSLETSFLLQRTELGNTYSEVLKAKSRYQELRSKIDAVKAKYAPDTIWALMMTKKCETEEQSKNLTREFMDAKIDMDTFLEKYIPLREVYNERTFKVEKLAQKITRNLPVSSSRPQLSRPPGSLSDPAGFSGAVYPKF
ncbi:hypothetical protein CRM22_000232 [Opisthorchis felineus]|uniref:VPS37 C-terminal domain-containing protein n=1 Tax=Opisthorchis felineus TaxID=147828 RepID=A0A4S2MKQ0_OPIFE|nr:hypothetical protein CRM22_000232 [Opisthorchis felineus]TGZ75678.1 hypothetical protein CRM22_000232 [Opisthorchis felineus]TGZ75679.1 hypothetical protein CRM22_000232 [Opisthorchis felineus]